MALLALRPTRELGLCVWLLSGHGRVWIPQVGNGVAHTMPC